MRGRKWLWAAVLVGMIAALVPAAWAAPGDVDGVNGVELKDAVLSLKVAAGLAADGVTLDGDVDGDEAIGLAEAVFALRDVAMSGPTGRARAVLGPLAGATVKVFRLNDLENAIYSDVTDDEGYFDTQLLPEDLTKYVLVAVSGGEDVDADDDGVLDATPTPNAGTIHGLMTAAEFQEGGFQVSALSDIVWQYTKNLVGEVDEAGLRLRLNELAGTLFNSDLNENGEIGADDVLAFVPMLAEHREKLVFDYGALFVENGDGHSIIGCYHGNLPDVLVTLLEDKFWSRLTLLPGADPDYDKVKIEVARFGRGKVVSDAGGIDIDSERADLSENTRYAFFERRADGKVVFTATPINETEILGWEGCDKVSEDKIRCECALVDDRVVSVSFGYKEAILKEGVTLVDLTQAEVAVGEGQTTLDVKASAGDTTMMTALADLETGNIVVGSSDGGFLRRLVSKEKVSDDHYILTTEDASLEDVLAQGTVEFSKQMTHGDLVDVPDPRSRAKLSDTEGFHLVPSDNPSESVFRMVIGDPRQRDKLSGELKWPLDDPIIKLKGNVEVTIDVEWGVSVGGLFSPGIESVKFIPRVKSLESLDLSLISETELVEYETPVGKPLKFSPIILYVGVVPVVIKPEVQVMLGIEIEASGEITAGISLKQMIRGGFIYNRGVDVNAVGEFDHSHEFTPPTLSGTLDAKPYVEVKPVMYLYGLTGPAVSIEGYFRLKGEYEKLAFTNDFCEEGISVTAKAGLKAGFEWDLGTAKKLGEWAEDVELKVDFTPYETLLKKWNIDGICTNRPPFMEVFALDMNGIVTLGSSTPIVKEYTVKNSGDLDMEWEARWFEDGVTTVSPKSGTLGSGDSVAVTVAVATSALDIGPYGNLIKFDNLYDDGILSTKPDGDTIKHVHVVVMPPPLSAPLVDQPEMATGADGEVIPSKVNLRWRYPDSATLKYVDGYIVWRTTDPDSADSLSQVAVIPDSGVTSYQVAGLNPDTKWFFAIDAYGADVETGLSEMVSITTPAVLLDRFTNSLGMTFVQIPEGTFMMGSPEDEWTASDREWPQHEVTLTEGFYMMTTEVTQAQWAEVMGRNPSYFGNCGGDCPVEEISWNDIVDFITALNAMDGRTYRLPTEAEWEYAARAGTTTAFYSGGITETGGFTTLDPNLDQIGWYGGNSCVAYEGGYNCSSWSGCSTCGAHPVAQKQPNAWGLYDMSGNVFEWVEDDWHSSYDGAPTNGSAWVDSPRASDRVVRGGSWSFGAWDCRSAVRAYGNPTDRIANGHVGFRLALSPGR